MAIFNALEWAFSSQDPEQVQIWGYLILFLSTAWFRIEGATFKYLIIKIINNINNKHSMIAYPVSLRDVDVLFYLILV